ncbi:MAG: hypothetical protein ACKO54_25055, partial [Alphaproteobacteria bacterium]
IPRLMADIAAFFPGECCRRVKRNARAIAAKIAANPPQAVRLTKRLLRESQHTRLSTLLEMSAAYQALAHGTRDHREAVDAMLEKRAPSFEGR